MKDIMLKITGKVVSATPKIDNGFEGDTVELITGGSLTKRGGITKITYEETELSGIDGCTTSLIISDGKLKMKREGGILPAPTIMEFEAGKRYEGLYETPAGPIGMEILTNNIKIETDKKFSIDYSMSLKGLMESRNTIDIEVLQ